MRALVINRDIFLHGLMFDFFVKTKCFIWQCVVSVPIICSDDPAVFCTKRINCVFSLPVRLYEDIIQYFTKFLVQGLSVDHEYLKQFRK